MYRPVSGGGQLAVRGSEPELRAGRGLAAASNHPAGSAICPSRFTARETIPFGTQLLLPPTQFLQCLVNNVAIFPRAAGCPRLDPLEGSQVIGRALTACLRTEIRKAGHGGALSRKMRTLMEGLIKLAT